LLDEHKDISEHIKGGLKNMMIEDEVHMKYF
jgi:hypothetical protein